MLLITILTILFLAPRRILRVLTYRDMPLLKKTLLTTLSRAGDTAQRKTHAHVQASSLMPNTKKPTPDPQKPSETKVSLAAKKLHP